MRGTHSLAGQTQPRSQLPQDPIYWRLLHRGGGRGEKAADKPCPFSWRQRAAEGSSRASAETCGWVSFSVSLFLSMALQPSDGSFFWAAILSMGWPTSLQTEPFLRNIHQLKRQVRGNYLSRSTADLHWLYWTKTESRLCKNSQHDGP